MNSSSPVARNFRYPSGTISVDDALRVILERARGQGEAAGESVGLDDALGRILAADVSSSIDVPGYDNSQMDGYAVRSAELGEEGGEFPVAQRIVAGTVGRALEPGNVARIFTGAPMPAGADAVVMQERARIQGQRVWLPGGIPAGDNVRPRGNDLRAGEQVMQAGSRLTPRHVGLLASLGIQRLRVTPRLRVATLASGDELRLPGESLGPGEIYNSNRYTLRALLTCLGVSSLDLGVVPDSFDATRAALLEGAGRADVLVSTGGMSVGEEDHVKAALQAVGRLTLWRVAVKPGKPIAYGRVGDADFLGLPGNPVSTLVTFCLFVRPFLLKRMGARELHPPRWPVRADFEWPVPRRRREFARARIHRDRDGTPWATLHERQGSDVMSSTTWAHGLVEIMEGTTLGRGDWLPYLDFQNLTC